MTSCPRPRIPLPDYRPGLRFSIRCIPEVARGGGVFYTLHARFVIVLVGNDF